MLFPNNNSYWPGIDTKQTVFVNKKKTSYIKS